MCHLDICSQTMTAGAVTAWLGIAPDQLRLLDDQFQGWSVVVGEQ
jgi:hypothetical protein